jgi:carbamoyltransferase
MSQLTTGLTNKNLHRTEFMPFAPVTMEKDQYKCYKNMEGAEHTAKFMTITFECTDYLKEKCPAVVHVDGTARPQIIYKDINPSYYRIVEEYYKITGLPALINTSFNMHEEPIVCTPGDAIRSFQRGHLGYLAIGNFLVQNIGMNEENTYHST